MDNKDKPFSMPYVLRTTVKHMRKSIETSIRKTFERMSEFDSNNEKAREVLETLSQLHSLMRSIDAFQASNQSIFRGK